MILFTVFCISKFKFIAFFLFLFLYTVYISSFVFQLQCERPFKRVCSLVGTKNINKTKKTKKED